MTVVVVGETDGRMDSLQLPDWMCFRSLECVLVGREVACNTLDIWDPKFRTPLTSDIISVFSDMLKCKKGRCRFTSAQNTNKFNHNHP